MKLNDERDDDPDPLQWHVRIHHPTLEGAMVGRNFDTLLAALDCRAANPNSRLIRHIEGDMWARFDEIGTYYVPGTWK